MNKEVQVEDEKMGVPAMTVLVERPQRREKHRASKQVRVNTLSMTVGKGASVPTEEATT